MATVTMAPGPSPPSKRQRLTGSEPETYPYPDSIPRYDEQHEEMPQGLLDIRCVPMTDSSEWGSRELAAARACLTDEVTPENETFIRTYHPSLRNESSVCVVKEENGNELWLLYSDAPLKTTHAAGRAIHLHPIGLRDVRETIHYGGGRPDPLPWPVNPRRFLSERELDMIRHMFPSAVGARVFVSGFIMVLFETYNDILKSIDQDGVTSEFGNLRLRYDVLKVIPSTQPPITGSAITSLPDGGEFASIGVKIQFEDDTKAITVPTHAFIRIKTHGESRKSRIFDLFAHVKQRLGRFKPISFKSITSPIIRAITLSKINSPIGKPVFLAGQRQPLGTIKRTFDNIPPTSKPIPFPDGFQHDLSLVTSDNLPRITISQGRPQIVGWADYNDALAGHPVFIHKVHSYTGNLQPREGQIGSNELREAIIEGTEYTWNREVLAQNVSIIWRVAHDGDRLYGFSGTALCLGRPTDSTCRVLCFQNFQIPLFDTKLQMFNFIPPPSKEHNEEKTEGQPGGKTGGKNKAQNFRNDPFINGGFVLPAAVRAATIVCGEDLDRGSIYSTYPPRSSQDGAALRRSFSSHQG